MHNEGGRERECMCMCMCVRVCVCVKESKRNMQPRTQRVPPPARSKYPPSVNTSIF